MVLGGVLIEVYAPKTPVEWCENYGLEVDDKGLVVLYKAVGRNFESDYGTSYAPGSTPNAPDWDGGREECGGGLHFSPSPGHTYQFVTDPAHFVACPVALDELVVHPDGQYPEKVKAPRVAAPCWEVDRYGKPVERGA